MNETIDKLVEETRDNGKVNGLIVLTRSELHTALTRAFTLGRTSALDDALGVVPPHRSAYVVDLEGGTQLTLEQKEGWNSCRDLVLKGLRDLKK